jgi:hypothetical protein
MNSRLFESFCEMLDKLPARAVLKAVVAERRMIEEDLERMHTTPTPQESSVLAMCRFLEVIVAGKPDPLPPMTVDQWVACRRVLEKLTAAGELPHDIERHFDTLFSTILRRAFV